MSDIDSVETRKKTGPVYYWLAEIAAAQKREKDFRKEGRRVLEIYNGERPDAIPFNILYSNTETLLPALYNSTPRPVVQRRFKDDDPVGKAAGQVGQRALEYLVDTNSEEYASFDEVMMDAVLDGLLPGRGTTRIKYDYESGSSSGTEVVTYETICYESIKWDRWVFGYSKKWVKTPWLAIQHAVTKKEAGKLFGAEAAAKLRYTAENDKDEDEQADDAKSDTSEEQDQRTAIVWEIWDKSGGRKVRFVAECYKEDYLKVDDDPLGLTGFYPIPEPLRFHRKSNDQLPTSLYKLYENQAKELNRITVRINRVVEACKVRGVYDSTLGGDIENLLKKDDNQMVGAENVAALQNGGLDKAIWLMPVEKLISVLQQLYVAREACKRTIYEITGISDILRGASAASETLGAQEIKQNWATLRLKRMQKEVQRYARDILRITLEIAATKFKQATFQKMTGLPLPTDMEKKALQGQMAAMQAAGAMGQQVPPPPPQVLTALQSPTWEQALAVLKDDTERQYKTDIETNSTVDLEATEDQKNLADMMNSISQFMNGVAPLVESGALDINAAKGMLLFIVRKQRMGSDIEDYIKAMKAPQPKDDGKAAMAQKDGEIEKMKLQQKDASEKGAAQLKQQSEMASLQLEQAQFQFEQKLEAAKLQGQRELELAKIEAQKAVELAKLSSQRAMEERKMLIQQETELKKAALAADTQLKVAQISAATAEKTAEKSAETAKETARTSADTTVKTAEMSNASSEKVANISAAASPATAKVKETESVTKVMNQILEGQDKLLKALTAPREVERDSSGKVVRLVPQVKAAK